MIDVVVKKIFIFLILLVIPNVVFAQRGCCSHHGGVAGCNSNGSQVCNDGTVSPSCTCTPSVSYIYGCTDSVAKNYNSSANRDDGSCIYYKYGCINPDAINYDSSANTPDGSCQFLYVESYEKIINYNVKKIDGDKEEIKQKGKNGKKVITSKIIKDENGNVISTEVINETILEEPVEEIIVYNSIDSTEDNILVCFWGISIIIYFIGLLIGIYFIIKLVVKKKD